MEKKEFDLFELIRILLVNRKFVIIFVGIVAIAAVTYSLLAPQIWSSSASFYAVGAGGSSLPFNLPGLGGLTASFLNMGASDQALSFINAMESREFSEGVIRKFKLIDYYELSDPDSLFNMDKALKKLRQKTMKVVYDEESGLITIAAETKDKQLSMDIVNHYLQYLDTYNRSQKVTKSKMNREYLEKRVNVVRAELDSLIIAMRDFQKENNAIDLPTQSTALISSYSDAIAQKMKFEIEYQLALQNYSKDSPQVKQLDTTRKEIDRQIKELEKSDNKLKPQFLIDITKIPDLGSKYAQLKLNLEIKAKVFEYLYPQYELALIDELRDMPTLDILDTPRLAGMRERPRRAIICILSTIAGFIMACVIVIMKTVYENNKERIMGIRKSL